MKEFDALLAVADRLLGPQGCPWDHKQTFFSLQPYVLEEAHEVVEAVDSNEDAKIIEELGDLLYTVIFYAKLGEKEKRFSITEILSCIREKLIRRHPHVFGELEVKDTKEIERNWEKIKKEEKKGEKEGLDKAPASFPALMRAQKVIKKLKRMDPDFFPIPEENKSLSEKEVGEKMLALIATADAEGIDVESALRRTLADLEKAHRAS